MAKVKGPLFSISASGKIADTLVYFPWKGLQVVRQFIVPSDPKSTSQVAQRGLMTNAVSEFHAALYTDFDREAWNRAATHDPKIMTGFNKFTKAYILVHSVAGKTWFRLQNAVTSTITSTGFTVTVSTAATGTLAPTIRWGLTPGTLLNSAPMTGVGMTPWIDWEHSITGLAGKTVYFFRIEATDATVEGETGIYDERTS